MTRDLNKTHLKVDLFYYNIPELTNVAIYSVFNII